MCDEKTLVSDLHHTSILGLVTVTVKILNRKLQHTTYNNTCVTENSNDLIKNVCRKNFSG